ncbi:MAG TPA: CDP-diacylglycerol--glycerol-3-phosphate 3-phosphatidyltransferase [Candidatus Bathyarchaeia archaeon]|nr:CDP-diacylglycerol--glycerol-3-phosphate 3-phosphatidyltransferase [Candidatus Bathyarchaeia archaeon]
MDRTDFTLVPNVVTLVRLIGSPILLPLLFVYLLPLNIFFLNLVLAALFLVLSSTDFLDGYLARKYDQVTSLGRMLDPIADKFLVYAALVALLAAGKLSFLWVIVLMGREFFVMGLRQVALEYQCSIPVSFWSKIKTVLQVVSLTVVILNPYAYEASMWSASHGWFMLQGGLLLVTTILAMITAWKYAQHFNRMCMVKTMATTPPSFDKDIPI